MSSRGGGGGGRGGAGAIRTSRPGIKAGTGGSLPAAGGSAPTLPSDTTVGTAAATWVSWGGAGHRYMSTSMYPIWKGYGFAGHIAKWSNGSIPGDIQDFKVDGSGNVISASGQSSPGVYDQQKCFEGLNVPTAGTDYGNGSSPGGLYVAKGSDSSILAGLLIGVPTSTGAGNSSNATMRADVATRVGRLADGVKFLGGEIVGFDMEGGTWTTTGTSFEQYGYQVGVSMWTKYPAMELWLYFWGASEGSWHILAVGTNYQNAPYTPTPDDEFVARTQFIYGLCRGRMDAAGTGKIRLQDHFFYRGSSGNVPGATVQTGLKWNTQGRFAATSRGLSQTVYDSVHAALTISPFSWAGTDGNGFYDSTQQGEPAWTNDLVEYRKWGMGRRAEFNLGGDGTPGIAGSSFGGEGLWAGHENYAYPTNRLTNIAPSVSATAISTSAPTFSNVSAVASGGNVTVTCRAAHAYGIWYVRLYRGSTFNPASPSASLIGAMPMTFTLNGGTPTGGLGSDYQACSRVTTGTAGEWFVIAATSIKDDVAWTKVQAA